MTYDKLGRAKDPRMRLLSPRRTRLRTQTRTQTRTRTRTQTRTRTRTRTQTRLRTRTRTRGDASDASDATDHSSADALTKIGPGQTTVFRQDKSLLANVHERSVGTTMTSASNRSTFGGVEYRHRHPTNGSTSKT